MSTRVRRARVAVTTVFFVNGLLVASVLSRLPEIKGDLGLDTGRLGLALLGLPLGLLLAQPLVALALARWSTRAVTAATLGLCATAAVVPSLAGRFGTLFAAMVALGATNGSLDVAMNAQGVVVERAAAPRRVFASLHAAFSFGALAGAGLAALAAAAGLGLTAHVAVVAVVGLGVGLRAVAAFGPTLPRPAADAGPQSAPRTFAVPSRALAALGAVSFCALLAEGAIADWSAVHLRDDLDAGTSTAALGLAAFSLAMGVGRLTGDRVAERFGARRLVRAGALLAALGLAAAAIAASPVLAATAFAAMGVGLACVFPLSLRAAADVPGTTDTAAIAMVTAIGYLGLLAGPPAIGLLAHATSLRLALGAVASLCVLAALLASAVGDPAP